MIFRDSGAIDERTRQAAEELLAVLEGVEEGYETSTAALASRVVDDESQLVGAAARATLARLLDDTDGLFDLNSALYDGAAAHGLDLDNSASEGMLVGLPFSIPFVVRRLRG